MIHVKKAETEQFRFLPHLCCIHTRTEGGYNTGACGLFTISHGLQIHNSISGRSANVVQNTAIADSSGGMNLRKANKKTRQYCNGAAAARPSPATTKTLMFPGDRFRSIPISRKRNNSETRLSD